MAFFPRRGHWNKLVCSNGLYCRLLHRVGQVRLPETRRRYLFLSDRRSPASVPKLILLTGAVSSWELAWGFKGLHPWGSTWALWQEQIHSYHCQAIQPSPLQQPFSRCLGSWNLPELHYYYDLWPSKKKVGEKRVGRTRNCSCEPNLV